MGFLIDEADNVSDKGRLCHSSPVLQMAMLSVEMCSVQEESERMRAMSEARDPSEQLQSAIRDRDDAISK